MYYDESVENLETLLIILDGLSVEVEAIENNMNVDP